MSIQCKFCEKNFLNLSLHLYYKHRITGKDYLAEFPELGSEDLITPSCWTKNAQQKKLYDDYRADELYQEKKRTMSKELRDDLEIFENKIIKKYGERRKFKDPNAWNFLVLVELNDYLRVRVRKYA